MECKITRCLFKAPPIGSLHAICSTSTQGSGSTAPEPNIQVSTPEDTELVSEDKVICILPHCGLKARNTDLVLALLVLALGFKEQRAVQPGLLTFTLVHACESGNHQFISTGQYLILRAQ